MARYFEADVTAVCNGKNVELVRSLGADRVIDYEQEEFTKDAQRYDVVFDAVSKLSFRRCRGSMKRGGVYVATDLGFLVQNPILAFVTKRVGGQRVVFPIPRYTKQDVLFLKEFIEAGRYRAVIDRRYPLEQVVEASRYVEAEQKTGNVIRAAWAVHRAITRLTGGRRGLSRPGPGGWGTMRLTTVGRRTGKTRSAILGYYEDGPNLVTMAMNGWGAPEPAWWLNLLAHPNAKVELKTGRARSVRGPPWARSASASGPGGASSVTTRTTTRIGDRGGPRGPRCVRYSTGRNGGSLKLPLPLAPLTSDVFIAYCSVA